MVAPTAEVTGEFSVPNSEGLVFEAACGLLVVAPPAVTLSAVSGRYLASSLCQGMVFDAACGCFERTRRLS